MDDRLDLLRDRQLDPVLRRQLERATHREHAFRHAVQVRCRIGPRHARGHQLAGPSIAGDRAHAGGDQVADTGQAGESQLLRPRSNPEARHLGQAAGDDARLAAVAQPEPIDEACRQGDHVLQCAGQFNPDQVCVGVDPKAIAAQHRAQLGRQLGVVRGDHAAGWKAIGDLARQVRPGERSDTTPGKLVLDHLAHAQVRPLLDPLHHAEQRGVRVHRVVQALQGRAQVRRGNRQHI